MKILFVTSRYPTPATPGNSPALVQQRQSLERLGHEVDVLLIPSTLGKRAYGTAIPRLIARTMRTSYDVVHAHYGYFVALVSLLRYRAPVVITFRGSDVLDASQRSLSCFTARRAAASIVMTLEMKRVLGVPDKTTVAPYGVDTELFAPQPVQAARQALGLPLDAPLILFPYDPARPEKRYDLVEQAFAQVKAALPGARIVTVFGQPHERIVAYMSACDAMVLTSDHEGAPTAIREAMACNLPIVSVDVGDVAALIAGLDQCCVVDREPGSIAERLIHVLSFSKRSNGRAAAQTLSLEHVARQVESVYRSVVRASPATAVKRLGNP